MPFHTFNKYGPSHPANIYQLRKDQIFLLLSSFCHSLAQHNSLLTSFEWKLIFQSWFIDIYTVSRGTCNHNLSTLKDLSNPQINNYAIRSGSFTISESREFLKSPSWHQSISDLFPCINLILIPLFRPLILRIIPSLEHLIPPLFPFIYVNLSFHYPTSPIISTLLTCPCQISYIYSLGVELFPLVSLSY